MSATTSTLLTAVQAAERLGVTPQRVRQICGAGVLGRKLGFYWVIEAKELAKYDRQIRKKAGRPAQK